MVSTKPQHLTGSNKNTFKCGASFCETALITSWDISPPTIAATGETCPNEWTNALSGTKSFPISSRICSNFSMSSLRVFGCGSRPFVSRNFCKIFDWMNDGPVRLRRRTKNGAVWSNSMRSCSGGYCNVRFTVVLTNSNFGFSFGFEIDLCLKTSLQSHRK